MTTPTNDRCGALAPTLNVPCDRLRGHDGPHSSYSASYGGLVHWHAKPRGLAALSPEARKRIASLGGKAANAQGKAHKWTPETARAAGQKGGSTPKRPRVPKTGAEVPVTAGAALGLRVMVRQCATCIYRPDSPLDLQKLEADVADPRMAGHFRGYRVCHHAADQRRTGPCCRGFWDRHRDQFDAGQLAQRLGLVVFVDE